MTRRRPIFAEGDAVRFGDQGPVHRLAEAEVLGRHSFRIMTDCRLVDADDLGPRISYRTDAPIDCVACKGANP